MLFIGIFISLPTLLSHPLKALRVQNEQLTTTKDVKIPVRVAVLRTSPAMLKTLE